MRAFDHPSRLSLRRLALLADHPVTPRLMEQIPGFVRVVAALQVHHDLIGQVKLEPVEFSTIGRSRDDSALAPARADPHA